MTKKQQKLFGETKYEYLGKIISLKDPDSAKKSVKKLEKEYNNAKTKTKKLRIMRAVLLASNRSFASGKRKNLSAKEKKEYKQIGKIYDELYGNLRILYENNK